MPVATPAQYAAMLDAAQKGGYAYPAINVTSLPTINGALKAFAESKSDGIIQVSTGGGEFASGTAVKDMALGAIVLAEAVHTLAANTNGNILTLDSPAFEGRPAWPFESDFLNNPEGAKLFFALASASMTRWTVDLSTGRCKTERLSDRPCELSKIDERFFGKPYRWGFLVGGERNELAELPEGAWKILDERAAMHIAKHRPPGKAEKS